MQLITGSLTSAVPTAALPLLRNLPADAAVVQPRQQASMREEEYALLDRVVRSVRPRETLELGMANGRSTEIICGAVRDLGGVRHTSIDPFQNDPKQWSSAGVDRIRKSGLSAYHELIEENDYTALPSLVAAGRTFEFILIDGWHSFDHTLLDLFYADLLLVDGGVVVIHDTGWPAVYKACRFLETHKPYELISPAPSVILRSTVGRIARRFRQTLSGRFAMADARRRRNAWYSLSAYRKLESRQVPDCFYAPF